MHLSEWNSKLITHQTQDINPTTHNESRDESSKHCKNCDAPNILEKVTLQMIIWNVIQVKN